MNMSDAMNRKRSTMAMPRGCVVDRLEIKKRYYLERDGALYRFDAGDELCVGLTETDRDADVTAKEALRMVALGFAFEPGLEDVDS